MHSLFALIPLVASACAYQVTNPNNVSGWTTGGPNTLTWQRVDTDPSNFTLVLVNQNTNVLPTGQEILVAQVDGTTGSLTVPSPSSGFPVGSAFQVNFVKDPQDLNTILAQSNQFNITSSTGNSTSTTASQSNAVVTPAAATTAAAAQTTGTDSTGGDLNPTSSSTNTTASKNGADHVTAAGGTSLIFAALVAFIF